MFYGIDYKNILTWGSVVVLWASVLQIELAAERPEDFGVGLVSAFSLGEAASTDVATTRTDSAGPNDLPALTDATSFPASITDVPYPGSDERSIRFVAEDRAYLALSFAEQQGLEFIGDQSFSVAIWVIPTSLQANEAQICGLWNENASGNGDDRGWVVRFDNANRPRFNVNHTGSQNPNRLTVTASTPLVIDRWTHLAVVADLENDNVRFYFDGVLESGHRFRRFPGGHSGARFAVGGSSEGARHYFDGLLRDLGIWSRALSENEIGLLANACREAASLTLNVDRVGDTIRLTFSSIIDQQYRIEQNDNLRGEWSQHGPVLIGSGAELEVFDPISLRERFYRLVLVGCQ